MTVIGPHTSKLIIIVKLLAGDSNWTSEMISQLWLKLWLAVVEQQAIISVSVDPGRCNHLMSLGHIGSIHHIKSQLSFGNHRIYLILQHLVYYSDVTCNS